MPPALWPLCMPSFSVRGMAPTRNAFHAMMEKVLREKQAARASDSADGAGTHDMIDVILELQAGEGALKLTEQEICDEIIG